MSLGLTKYTSTYTDVAGNTFDSPDLLAEFDRVEQFLNNWIASYTSIGVSVIDDNSEVILTTNHTIEPTSAIVSRMVQEDVENINFFFGPREDGDPYRLYCVLRFQGKGTTFSVSGPAGKTHIFGLGRPTYQPSQVATNNFYNAVVIATYSTAGGVFLQVFANNDESTSVSTDDILTTRAL